MRNSKPSATRLLLTGAILATTAVATLGSLSSPALAAPEPTARAEKAPSKDQKEVRQLFASTLNEAISTGDLDKFLDGLTKSARERVQDNIKPESRDRFKAAAEKFRNAWQEKYGKSFNVADDSSGAFQNFNIDVQDRGERQLAVILVQNPEDQKQYNVHAVKQGAGWRLLLSEREEGKYLAANLSAALTKAVEDGLPNSADNGASMILTRFYKNVAYGTDSTADTKDR